MNNKPESITIAVADDHALFRKGLVKLIQSLGEEYKVVVEASDGQELLQKIDGNSALDLALIDINMPHKDGYETVKQIKKHHPDIKMVIISMIDKEESVVRMLRLGVKGYLSKDVEPNDLKAAIKSVMEKGYYYTDFITGRLVHDLQKKENLDDENQISQREMEFLSYACSELTYKEIADKMGLSIKTVDGFRDALFKKFAVASRVGLVIYAFKKGLVSL